MTPTQRVRKKRAVKIQVVRLKAAHAATFAVQAAAKAKTAKQEFKQARKAYKDARKAAKAARKRFKELRRKLDKLAPAQPKRGVRRVKLPPAAPANTRELPAG